MFKSLTLTAAIALVSTAAFAYQVTGPVTAVNDKSITVQKGKEKWEIARGNASVPADVKVGSKVTVEYDMTASNVTSKDAPKTAKQTITEEKSKASAALEDKAKATLNEKLAPASGSSLKTKALENMPTTSTVTH
jgi:hypothetical protein